LLFNIRDTYENETLYFDANSQAFTFFTSSDLMGINLFEYIYFNILNKYSQYIFYYPNKIVNKFSNIKERALHIAKIKGISKEVFCSSISMSYGSFKGSAKGRPLNSDAIENILTIYNDINPEWLLIGIGEMLLNKTNNRSSSLNLPETQKKDHYIIDLQKQRIIDLEEKIDLLKKELESYSNYYKVAEPNKKLGD